MSHPLALSPWPSTSVKPGPGFRETVPVTGPSTYVLRLTFTLAQTVLTLNREIDRPTAHFPSTPICHDCIPFTISSHSSILALLRKISREFRRLYFDNTILAIFRNPPLPTFKRAGNFVSLAAISQHIPVHFRKHFRLWIQPTYLNFPQFLMLFFIIYCIFCKKLYVGLQAAGLATCAPSTYGSSAYSRRPLFPLAPSLSLSLFCLFLNFHFAVNRLILDFSRTTVHLTLTQQYSIST